MSTVLRLVASATMVAACIAVASPRQVLFKPPQVTSATDAYLPYQVVYDGFVVLEVFLGSDGAMTETKALRDPGAMVRAAVTSIRTWKFRPAEDNGRALPSAMTTIFVYRPRNNGPAPVMPPTNFRPVVPRAVPHADGKPDYVPAGIASVVYPEYPVNSVAWGSFVVQVTVNPEGKTENPEVLYGMAPFKELALSALQEWRFQPATFGGNAVASRVAVAFIFQTPS